MKSKWNGAVDLERSKKCIVERTSYLISMLSSWSSTKLSSERKDLADGRSYFTEERLKNSACSVSAYSSNE